MKKLEAILFDLDGVLVDACDWHYIALNKALLKSGYIPISKDDHLKTFNGLPTKIKLNMLGIPSTEVNKINKLKQKYTIESIKKFAKIMPEKIELLSFLKDQDYKIACVTNSIRDTAEEMLYSTGQFEYMDLIVTNEDVKRNKPNPDPYNFAISKLEVDPKNVLCVEDSDIGLRSAFTSKAMHVLPVKDTAMVNKSYIEQIIKDLEEKE